MRIIPEDIKEYLEYNPKEGTFKWIKSYHDNVVVNSKAGHIAGSNGYWEISFKSKRYLAHRVAWFLYYGEQPGKVLDHRNRNKLDNRICNLRAVTQRENTISLRCEKRNGLIVAKYRKSCNTENKWESRIIVDRKSIYLGVFKTEIEAHNAYMDKLKIIEAWDKSK